MARTTSGSRPALALLCASALVAFVCGQQPPTAGLVLKGADTGVFFPVSDDSTLSIHPVGNEIHVAADDLVVNGVRVVERVTLLEQAACPPVESCPDQVEDACGRPIVLVNTTHCADPNLFDPIPGNHSSIYLPNATLARHEFTVTLVDPATGKPQVVSLVVEASDALDASLVDMLLDQLRVEIPEPAPSTSSPAPTGTACDPTTSTACPPPVTRTGATTPPPTPTATDYDADDEELGPSNEELERVFFEEAGATFDADPELGEIKISPYSADGSLMTNVRFSWPEMFEATRPGILTLKPDYIDARPISRAEADLEASRTPKWEPYQHPATGTPTDIAANLARGIRGRLLCRAPQSPTATVENPLAFTKIQIDGASAYSDENGFFDLQVADEVERPSKFEIEWHANVVSVGSSGSSRSTPLKVMNEWHRPRRYQVNLAALAFQKVGDSHVYGDVVVSGVDCEIWQLGVRALRRYHLDLDASPPYGSLRVKRWTGVYQKTAYAFYDYINLPTNWIAQKPDDWRRRNTFFHEFGHSVRHVADGSVLHWNWDNFRFVYARIHHGNEISNVQFSFNEGWAGYFREALGGSAVANTLAALDAEGDLPGVEFRDWVEVRVAARLAELSTATTTSVMVRVLTTNRKRIHSLWQFEQKYCQLLGSNAFCLGGKPRRAPPSACPPGYHNDGLTCRLVNIKAKQSQHRGIGLLPKNCGPGNEYDAGLCYPNCKPGYNGVGPICWEKCPSGYHNDGITCRKPGHIVGVDNESCPGWDKCGVGFAKGCATCPAGYKRFVCTCHRAPHIFLKDSYGRGVGKVPKNCDNGRVLELGLCYKKCPSGWTGVGVSCLAPCSVFGSGWNDHGLTCYKPPHIIIRG